MTETDNPTPEVQPKSGWQPIETAPKDGSWIVLSDGQRVLPDRWIEWGRDGSASWDHCRYLQPIYWQPLPAPPSEPVPAPKFDLVQHLTRQREWSRKTFGPGNRTAGVVDHIRKELAEIEADPADIMEWVDVVILAFDGAWRAGWEPADIVRAIVGKQAKNEARAWPDWRTMPEDKAIEHVRTLAKGESHE